MNEHKAPKTCECGCEQPVNPGCRFFGKHANKLTGAARKNTKEGPRRQYKAGLPKVRRRLFELC